jgi:excisionase family DNA binding protein
VTAEGRERAGQPHGLDGWSRATEAKGEGFNAEVAGEEDDWAITPAGMPLEPMVVVDANGSELELQAGAPARAEADLPQSVLTVDELAALLRVERKTVYAAIGRGEIPGVRRVGALLRVSRDRVLAWLAQGQDRVSRSRRSP